MSVVSDKLYDNQFDVPIIATVPPFTNAANVSPTERHFIAAHYPNAGAGAPQTHLQVFLT